jgi:hypothetical protein|eukprot:COSAG01_NODE_584_length_15174_cov_27.387901_13_plen_103_part_00
MLGGFTRSLSALVYFTLHTGAGVDSVVYINIYRNNQKLLRLYIVCTRARTRPGPTELHASTLPGTNALGLSSQPGSQHKSMCSLLGDDWLLTVDLQLLVELV